MALAPAFVHHFRVDGRGLDAGVAQHRRLLKLEERRALLGIDAPPELLFEIEDLERKLKGTQP